MATQNIQRVSFVGFAHMKTHKLLFTWNNVHWGRCDDDPRLKLINKLTGATAKKGTTPGQQWKLSWGAGGSGGTSSSPENEDMVFLSLAYPRGDLLFIMIAHNEEEFGDAYKEHVAYQFLRELEKRVEGDLTQTGRVPFPSAHIAKMQENELCVHFQQIVTELAQKYDDPAAIDRLAAVSKKTKALQASMKNNVNKMLKQNEGLHTLEEQTAAMEREAEDYDDAAEEIKEYFWWKDCRVTLLIAVVVVVVLGLIALCIYKSCVKDNDKGGGQDKSKASCG